MRDVHVTGAALVRPTAGSDAAEIRPARWAHKAARLARMDRLCALGLVAADAALIDAGLNPEEWAGERVAVVVGTALGCHATNEEYYRGLAKEGASPRLFAYTLPSSPAGEISIHYGARGPVETVVSGRHAGIEAVGVAARLVGSGRAEVAIAVAVEVGGGTLDGLGLRVREGGAAVVVESGERARARARARARIGEGVGEAIAVEEGDGAVEGVAALVQWIEGGPRGGEVRRIEVRDRAGGAAALVVVGGG